MADPLPGVSTPVPITRPLLVPQAEAARLLGVCERTIFTLRQRGVLETVKVGDKVLLRTADLERFAAGHGVHLSAGPKAGET